MWHVIKQVFRRGSLYFLREGCFYRAAALAYSTLLSIVPLLMITLCALHMVPVFSHIADQVQRWVLESFVTGAASHVVGILQGFAHNVVVLSTRSILVLVAICLLMIYDMNRAFNAIWGVSRRLYLFRTFCVYFLFLILTPMFMAFLMLMGTYLLGMPWLSVHSQEVPVFSKFVLHIISFCSSALLFTLMNLFLPATKVPLLAAVIGGTFTAVGFHVAKMGFEWYIMNLSGYKVVYGALSLLPIFLLWLYVCWIVILAGAVITRLFAEEWRIRHAKVTEV